MKAKEIEIKPSFIGKIAPRPDLKPDQLEELSGYDFVEINGKTVAVISPHFKLPEYNPYKETWVEVRKAELGRLIVVRVL